MALDPDHEVKLRRLPAGALRGRLNTGIHKIAFTEVAVVYQFLDQVEERHPPPPHKVFYGIGRRRMRLGAAEEPGELFELAECPLSIQLAVLTWPTGGVRRRRQILDRLGGLCRRRLDRRRRAPLYGIENLRERSLKP